MKKILFAAFSLFLLFTTTKCFAQANQTNTTPEPYKEDEFAQPLKDLRRFEIITLGSMPFVTLDSAIVYNGYKYVMGKTDKFNPLATADYSQKEMEKIIITSLCVSAGIGVSDYIINLVKRNSIKKRQRMQTTNIMIEENPDAIRIPLPDASDTQSGDFE